MKIIIISQPKSGTYLCSELLFEYKIAKSNLHLAQNYYHLYEGDSLDNYRKNPKNFKIDKPLADSIKLINEGHHAVCHLLPTQYNINLLNDFKKIILCRPIIQRKDSAKRWSIDTNRGLFNSDLYTSIKDWPKSEKTFFLTFEDLITEDQSKLHQLQLFLFEEIVDNDNLLIKKAKLTDTLTKSLMRKLS